MIGWFVGFKKMLFFGDYEVNRGTKILVVTSVIFPESSGLIH